QVVDRDREGRAGAGDRGGGGGLGDPEIRAPVDGGVAGRAVVGAGGIGRGGGRLGRGVGKVAAVGVARGDVDGDRVGVGGVEGEAGAGAGHGAARLGAAGAGGHEGRAGRERVADAVARV